MHLDFPHPLGQYKNNLLASITFAKPLKGINGIS
jgi:hypothetical protein